MTKPSFRVSWGATIGHSNARLHVNSLVDISLIHAVFSRTDQLVKLRCWFVRSTLRDGLR